MQIWEQSFNVTRTIALNKSRFFAFTAKPSKPAQNHEKDNPVEPCCYSCSRRRRRPYWWISRPQVITFSDDTTLTLLGADYGKRHARARRQAATGASTTRPTRAGARVVQTAVARHGTFNTPTDTLVVWLRAKSDQSSVTPNQYRSFQFYIYDKAGTACAQNSSRL